MDTLSLQSLPETSPSSLQDQFGEHQIRIASENTPEADFHFSCSGEWCQVTTNEFELVSYHFSEAA